MTTAAIAEAVPDPDRARVASLDVLRGAVIAGMIVVNAAAWLKYVGGYPAYPWLMHSAWAGFSLADAVFPAFVVMVGVSLAWSLAPAKAYWRDKVSGARIAQKSPLPLAGRGLGVGVTKGHELRASGLASSSPPPPTPPRKGEAGAAPAAEIQKAKAVRDVLWRSLRLILVGVLLSNLYWLADPEANPFRPMGVLQRIGLAYLAAALLFLTTGPRTRLAVIAVLLAGYWPLLLLPFPDGQTDLGQPGLNFVSWVDRAALGGHAYVKGLHGYDPEGLLGTLPAIAQALIGVAAGERLRARGRDPGAVTGLAGAGAVMAALGLIWSPALPLIKDVWSSSFVLLSSGLTLVALAGLYATLDLNGWRLWGAGFLAAFGVNAIAAYVLHMLTTGVLTTGAMRAVHDLSAGVLAPQAAALVPVLVFLLMIWAAMVYLAHRRWYVRI